MDILCLQNSQRSFRGEGHLHIYLSKCDGGGGGRASRDAISGSGDLFRGLYGQSRGRANSRKTGGGGQLIQVVCCFVPTRHFYPESFGEHPNRF